MAFRELLSTETLVFPGDNTGEIIQEMFSCFTRATSQAPSGRALCIYCQIDHDLSGSIGDTHYIFQWDSVTGERLDPHSLVSTSSLSDRLDQQRIQEWSNGQVMVREAGLCWVSLAFDEPNASYQKLNEPGIVCEIPPVNELFYWEDPEGGGNDSTPPEIYYDPRKGYVAHLGGAVNPRGGVNLYRNSTGEWLDVITGTSGVVDEIFDVTPPFAMALSNRDNEDGGQAVTMFNAETGVVYWVSRLNDPPANTVKRSMSWDRLNRRLVVANHITEVLGDSPTYLQTYAIQPIGSALIAPWVSREPRVNGVTKIATRLIGTNSEGIPNCEVEFVDQAVGDVAPVKVVTDEYGYAEAIYDGLTTGGAETITVNCTVPDGGPVTPSQGQGAGAAPDTWAPELHLDFTSVAEDADVSALLTEQSDWDQGTAYGVEGDTTVKRVNTDSSALLAINSGQDGTPSDATNGTWGGILTPAAALQVAEGERLWVGAWVYFEAAFDYTTSGAGLLCLRIGNDATANYIEINLKHTTTNMVGWVYENPDQTITDTNHDFTATDAGQIVDATWYWVQYSCLAHSNGATAEQRIWLNNELVWELVGTAGQHLESSVESLTAFTANESIPTLSNSVDSLDELIVFNNFEGNSPQAQNAYVSNVVWTKDPDDLLTNDKYGNKYISPALADTL